ncbi:serine/threonine protein kinase [Paracoccus sulfuroxidans]|uniref:Serine/threonine-protein kinase n=1 Tax=Paracoccus sulfuroxidans TaxID=384678 RepID=A0A562NNN3_9RHOB|nr:serine/threonine-protein kinase [Paracoccus sulfuroxidans]TWI33795.1 serine/threonine-protein kinase [Paracoccus sulfuroxidans]
MAEPGEPSEDSGERTVIQTPDAAPEQGGTDERTIFAEPSKDGATLGPAAAPTPEAEHRLVQTGTLINNNYRILSLVSAGGMGEVYRAENVFTGDPVAVKVVLPNLARDEAIIELFRREARVLVQLRDDAIVRYHNFVLDHQLGRYCLIMEFVEGRHLGTLLKDDGALSLEDGAALMRRLGTGLGAAHARGVTHRDLSPDNVILRDERIDEAVLIDFGIARSTELGDGLGGRFAGKFKFIAPEQLGHAGGQIGPWTDVYGLALLMSAVLRGTPLDMGDSVISASAARQKIPDLSGISHRIYPLLQHMLEPDPGLRPQDMGQVLRILDDPALLPVKYRRPLWPLAPEAELQDAPDMPPAATVSGAQADSESPFSHVSGRPRAQSQPEDVAPPPRRSLLPWVGGLLALVALGAGGWYFTRGPQAGPVVAGDPVESPAPLDLPKRDLQTREGLLASQPLPACAMALRTADGPNAGMIRVLSDAPMDATALLDAYQKAFSVRPDVITTQVDAAQCAAVDFLAQIISRPAAPLDMSVRLDPTADGFQMRGDVAGLNGRNLWLFLVTPQGGLHDMTGQAAPSQAGLEFGAAIRQVAQTEADAPYLLVAVATDSPLAAIAAAPAGVPGAELLPRVLDEIRQSGESPAVALEVIVPPTLPPATAPAPPDEG